MLHPFFIFLLSFSFFVFNFVNFVEQKSYASSIIIFPEKRPHNVENYSYSLESINDMILKEGGKTIGNIVTKKIKKNENLHIF